MGATPSVRGGDGAACDGDGGDGVKRRRRRRRSKGDESERFYENGNADETQPGNGTENWNGNGTGNPDYYLGGSVPP